MYFMVKLAKLTINQLARPFYYKLYTSNVISYKSKQSRFVSGQRPNGLLNKQRSQTVDDGDHWKAALECHVDAFSARADAAQIIAKIDRGCKKSEQDKEVIKELKETEKDYKQAKKSFSRIAETLDVKHTKVTRTYRRLPELRRTNATADAELEKGQWKLLKAREDFNNTTEKEETKRQKLILGPCTGEAGET